MAIEKKQHKEVDLVGVFRKRFNDLKTERDTNWLPHWKEINEYIEPRFGKFLTTETQRGRKKDQKIYNNRARLSLRTLMSGMMSGVTNPARPWFALKVGDDLMSVIRVRQWLDEVETRLQNSFARSNLYTELPKLYRNMGLYGIGAMLAIEDFDMVTRYHTFATGEFCVANDEKLKVGAFYREYQLTVEQVVGEFPWENLSDKVKNLWNNDKLSEKIEIVHAIERNDDRIQGLLDNKNMKFRSVHFEKGSSKESSSGSNTKEFLRISGFKRFPVFAPRWEVESNDEYGTSCPGMEALSDVKELQAKQKKKLQAIDRMSNPPVVAPATMVGKATSTLPGGISYADERDGAKGIRALYQIDPRVQELAYDVKETEERIKETFYVDLFRMVSQSDRREVTAREIDEQHEEKLLGLGPVLQRLDNELLDDLVSMQFERMFEGDLLPPAPPELEGQAVRIEYISFLHQAQRSIGINSIDRLVNFTFTMGKFKPDAMDKINVDRTVDKYCEFLSAPSTILNSEDEMAAIRQSRAQQQQAAATGQSMLVASEAAKNLSDTDLDKNNALRTIAQRFAQQQ